MFSIAEIIIITTYISLSLSPSCAVEETEMSPPQAST